MVNHTTDLRLKQQILSHKFLVAEIPGRALNFKTPGSWKDYPHDYVSNNFIRGHVHSNRMIVTANHIVENALPDFAKEGKETETEEQVKGKAKAKTAKANSAAKTPVDFSNGIPAGTPIWIGYQHSCEALHDIEWTRSQATTEYENLNKGFYVPTTSSLDPDAGTADADPLKADGTNVYTLGTTAEFPPFSIYMCNMNRGADLKSLSVFGPAGTNPHPMKALFPESIPIDVTANTSLGFTGKSGSSNATLNGLSNGDDYGIFIITEEDIPLDSFLTLQKLDVAGNAGS